MKSKQTILRDPNLMLNLIPTKLSNRKSLKFAPMVFRGMMKKGYKFLSKIQCKSIPLILSGADVIAMAPSSSWKTIAFMVLVLQKLRWHLPGSGVWALIPSLTRDLSIQTLKFIKELGRFTDLCSNLLVGGDSMEDKFEEIAQNLDIIIATPG